MEIIAHRGASHDAPENTLAAIHLAWQHNADAVEVDVRLSKDGHLVLIHDETTGRTAGVNKRIGDQTLAELRRLDAGRWKGRQWMNERIPSLEEAVESIPADKRLFVEIKCGIECVPALQKIIRHSGTRSQQLVLIGFSLPTMERIKDELPALEVCHVARLKRSWTTRRWSPRLRDLIARTKDARLSGLDLEAGGPITADFVKSVHDAGLTVYVWTVNSPAKAKKMAATGVDGLTTNRPGWLRERLK